MEYTAVANGPLGMLADVAFGPANGEVEGRFDTDLVGSFELGTEQVEVEVGVTLANLGSVVAPAVVIFGENVDVIDVPELQCLLNLGLPKLHAEAQASVDLLDEGRAGEGVGVDFVFFGGH